MAMFIISQDDRHKASAETLKQALEKSREIQSKMPTWATIYVDRINADHKQRTVRAFNKADTIK